MGPGAAIKWSTTAHETGYDPLLFLGRQFGDPQELKVSREGIKFFVFILLHISILTDFTEISR